MKSVSLRLTAVVALFSCALLARGAEAPALGDPLPVSPLVKVGKLANGLTYYIQKNARPAKKLELRLVVKAGSILEDEDQLGLAHFTEHMAFNGTTHFKRHELIDYLQSNGVKFGHDLNAYTGFDETVYVLPIPTDKKEVVERGFLVLEDWAHGLQFNEADIDSERGIVLEELRLGKGASDRMNKILYPKLFNGSRYAERLPIGKADVLRTFKPDAIKRFYRDWYRPDLMAVIAVGDIDPQEAEKLIRKHFGKLKNPELARPRSYAVIPERKQDEAVIVADKEASADVLYIRYPIEQHAEATTVGGYRADLVEKLYGMMLSQRMMELTQQADPPFIQGGSGRGKIVRGHRSFSASALLGKGGPIPAINALVQESERARQFGFTAAELERAKKGMLSSYERMHNERDKSDSAVFVAEYLRNFLEGEAIPGIDNEYAYAQRFVPGITLDEVNAAVRKALPADDKKLVILMGGEKATPQPAPAELLAAVDTARKTALGAREEKTYAANLLDKPPVAGSIVAEKQDKVLGTTELTLSNGIKVVLKPTDFRNDQVLMSAVRHGGQFLYGEEDIQNGRYASALAAQMGVLDYSPLDMQRMLAGRSVAVSVALGELTENVAGGTVNSDVETMLQMMHARLLQPRRDEALFKSFIGRQRDLAQSSQARPEAQFANTIRQALYGDNPRVAGLPRPQDFDKVDLDRALRIYRERFGSAKGFTFYFVGSFDPVKLKPLLATYVASLPVADIPVAYRDLDIRPARGVIKREVRRGKEAKSAIAIVFTGATTYSQPEQTRLAAAIEVLNLKLTEVLREKLGLIYGGGASGAIVKLPYANYSISLNLPCGPENVDKVIDAAFAEIRKLQQDGPAAADLAKVRQNWLNNHRRALSENGWWMGQLQAAALYGTDPAWAAVDYEKKVAALGAADVQAAARRYFDFGNYAQVVMNPETK
ncbi:M16 family metallopeptidase [Pseudoduganella chitinolytica]|uniref:Insulinase family protein n=1 Tax=Pseudoduganella chitinolytica TaxID=34070 RepID=A0ABY8BEC6_9BURK|nr:M16 family metallopeptidase [Pseudoduganella chitinolytica]WEF33743.1 insulinase family protein [Pseudoduganella chitinolytica]